MDFLLESNSHANYRNELFSQLADESEISLDFVKGYIERDMNVARFTALLPNYWPGFLHYFLINDEDLVIENSLRHIFRGNVKYEQMQIETLKEYLSSKIDPISFLRRAFVNDDDRIIDFVSDVNPKFEKLDCPENGLNLLNSICQAGHFQINPENIIFIINENCLGVQPLSSLGESPFSLIFSKNIEYLSNHLLANTDVAITTLTNSAPLVESENMITDLLNRCSHVNLKTKLLTQWPSKISNIKNIDDQTFWREVFALDKVAPYLQIYRTLRGI
jgi:hypothetical protein